MNPIIEKEIDLWLTTSRSINHAEQESNYRDALLRVRDARDAEWVEFLKKAHPSVLEQLQGETALKTLLS